PSPPAFVGIREVHRRRAEREAGDDGPHAMRFNFGFHERLLAIELTIRLGQRIYPRQPAPCHPPCRLDIDDGAALPYRARVALGWRLDYGSSVSGVLECRDALPYKEPEWRGLADRSWLYLERTTAAHPSSRRSPTSTRRRRCCGRWPAISRT